MDFGSFHERHLPGDSQPSSIEPLRQAAEEALARYIAHAERKPISLTVVVKLGGIRSGEETINVSAVVILGVTRQDTLEQDIAQVLREALGRAS